MKCFGLLTSNSNWFIQKWYNLTHWGRETHLCVVKLTIIASDNGLSPGRRQAIIWTNAGILLIGPLGTNFNEVNRNSYIFIQENAPENVVCEMASILSRPQCVNDLSMILPHSVVSLFALFLVLFFPDYVIDGTIHTNLTFDEDLYNSSSPRYIQLADEFTNAVSHGFMLWWLIVINNELNLSGLGPLSLTRFNFNPIMDK